MKEKTFSQIEQEAWDQRAGYYDDLFARISTQAIPFILDGLGSLAGKRHLDVACGTGHLVAAAAQRGAISEGVDFAPSMIEAARKNYPDHKYSLADAARLPFDDASFDAVTCAFGLSHLENPQEAVNEAFRILAPDGRFAFTLWFGPDDGNELQAIVKEAVAAHALIPIPLPDSWTQLRFADEQRCASLVQQAGFGRPDFKRLPIVGTFKKGEDVLANIEKLSVRSKMVINSQPAANQRRIKEAILARAEAQRTNGVIPMNWPALLVTAQKPRKIGGNQMPTQVEARYTLFDSLEEMLSTESLSSLLSKTVTRVECRPMDNHNGLAGGRLSYVHTDNGRFVLKRMSIESDWLMYATDDRQGRSVKLWQYGLLERLRPNVEHKTIACARDGGGWGILMHDLGEDVHWWKQPTAFAAIPSILDALARQHATFWNDPALMDERIGLSDTTDLLNGTSLPVARKGLAANAVTNQIPVWVVEGWPMLEGMWDRDLYLQMSALIEDPRPVIAALDRYPYTLLHGDFRDLNMTALPEEPLVLFDWQFAARSLMTVDLAYFAGDLAFFKNEAGESMSRAQADTFYRRRLETYLQKRFNDQNWEAMIDLGNLVDALRTACICAYFSKHGSTPEVRQRQKNNVFEMGQAAQTALRWL